MGVHFSDYLIFGVKVLKQITTQEVTKYNEDTGKPYQAFVKGEYWVIEGTSCFYQDLDDLESLDKDGFSFLQIEEDETFLLGITIYRTKMDDPEDKIIKIDLEHLSKICISNNEILKIKFPGCNPRLFKFMYCAY